MSGGIWFDWRGVHATVEVEFVCPIDGEDDCDEVEVIIDLYVSGWEHSYYRVSERDFVVEGVMIEAFGREYHFDLEDIIEDEGERDGFLEELASASDEHAAECRAEMHL